MAATSRWIPLDLDASSLQRGGRPVAVTGRTGRKLLLLRTHTGELTCLDAACFHQGADLSQGEVLDIENLGTVVRCPRHGRCVDARTGEWVEPAPLTASPEAACSSSADEWCRRGSVQRVHRVRVSAAGCVEAEIVSGGTSMPSDLYNVRAQQPAARPAGAGGGTIAWQSRKRSATEAVKERLQQQQQQPPSPASPPSQQPPAAAVMRQPQIADFFAASSSSPGRGAAQQSQSPDPMDTD